VIEALSQKVVTKKPRQTTVFKKEKKIKAFSEKITKRKKIAKPEKKIKAISVRPESKKI
jgi:hypothetical protein